MPTYEYECKKCKKRFERFQAISALPLKRCPFCNSRRLRRIIGAGAGVIFKGSGFYQTDYVKERARKTDTKESKEKESVKPKVD